MFKYQQSTGMRTASCVFDMHFRMHVLNVVKSALTTLVREETSIVFSKCVIIEGTSHGITNGEAEIMGEQVRWYGVLHELPAEDDEGADESAPLLSPGANVGSSASTSGANSEYRVNISVEDPIALMPPDPVLRMARLAGTRLPDRFPSPSAAFNCSALLERMCCWDNERVWDRIDPIKTAITVCLGVLTSVVTWGLTKHNAMENGSAINWCQAHSKGFCLTCTLILHVVVLW